MKRLYDIVVFGATGFTGRLTAEHLAKTGKDFKELKWAISGRDKVKLEKVKEDLVKINPDLKDKLGIIIADVNDKTSLDNMTKSTKVIADTAGPYSLYGPPVVKSCLDSGTHYCDITGEVPFLKDNIQKYHKEAEEKGVCIVSCCGLDSIPSDLGTFFIVNHIKEKFNRKTSLVKGYVGKSKGTAPGGTYETIRTKMSSKWLNDPYFLCDKKGPPGAKDAYFLSYDRDYGWTGPFLMSPINSRNVRRSASLLGYGDDFLYNESGGYKTLPVTLLATLFHILIMFFVFIPPIQKLVSKFLPKPGEGPSRQEMENGYWNYHFVGYSQRERGEKGVRVIGHVSHNKDPGCMSTSIMLAESALCLALQRNELGAKGGVLTPASCFGKVLLQRLQNQGFKFEIQKEEELK